MMAMLDEHKEALGSKLYVDLCNINGNFAKLERRAARMSKKLLEYAQEKKILTMAYGSIFAGDKDRLQEGAV